VEPYEPEFNESVIAIPDTVRERTLMSEMRGIVLAVGPLCWGDEPELRAAVGDKVLISKWSGVIVKGPLDGKMYRLCNADDIFCGLDGDMSEVLIKQEKKAVTQSPVLAGVRR
jgi:co-chaperonin GroES (HSP10)